MIGALFLSKMVYKKGKGWELRAETPPTKLCFVLPRGGGGGEVDATETH